MHQLKFSYNSHWKIHIHTPFTPVLWWLLVMLQYLNANFCILINSSCFPARRLFRMISENWSCLWHDLVENLNKLRWQWGFYLLGEAGSAGLSVTVWNGSSTTLSVLIANKHPRNGGGRLRNEALLVSTTICLTSLTRAKPKEEMTFPA